jgi:hypothetical protein
MRAFNSGTFGLPQLEDRRHVAKMPNRTHAPQHRTSFFDQIIGDREQSPADGQAERSSRHGPVHTLRVLSAVPAMLSLGRGLTANGPDIG